MQNTQSHTVTIPAPSPEIRVTIADRPRIMGFLDTFSQKWQASHGDKERERMYWFSYPKWGKGTGKGWDALGLGGTYVMRALIWYHHVYKPGSTEWRPQIIIRALLQESKAEPKATR